MTDAELADAKAAEDVTHCPINASGEKIKAHIT